MLCRFLHPITYGEYPKNMQEIVKDRLPKFTEDELKMVKGSVDFVGVNQYTAYYMYDNHAFQSKPTSYALDWRCGFACKIFNLFHLTVLFFPCSKLIATLM